MNTESPVKTIDALCALLQQAHFSARGLQQYLPDSGEETLADQIHRIRMLAVRLKSQLAETEEA